MSNEKLYVAKLRGDFYTMVVGELVYISKNKDYTIKLEDGTQKTFENERDSFKVFKNIDDCSDFIYHQNRL